MSVETMTRGGMARSSSRSTSRGCSQSPSSSSCSAIMSRLNGSFSWVQALSSSSHASCSAFMTAARRSRVASQSRVRPVSRSVRAAAASLASPQMPTVIFLTRPSILWSASIWMIFAFFGQ